MFDVLAPKHEIPTRDEFRKAQKRKIDRSCTEEEKAKMIRIILDKYEDGWMDEKERDKRILFVITETDQDHP